MYDEVILKWVRALDVLGPEDHGGDKRHFVGVLKALGSGRGWMYWKSLRS